MKRTYKSNHLYEVYSTLTCYKLKDNPTGSSNWLVSGKNQDYCSYSSSTPLFSKIQRGGKRKSDKCPSRNFRGARSSQEIYSWAPSCARVHDSMQSIYQIISRRQSCFLLCNYNLSESRMAKRISTTFKYWVSEHSKN